ncbi:MAG: alpha/beta fold hydrolase [Sphingopyxis sp.]|uniref:alpha/beta hydrolase family protein n=1 Tax=Sphingopyxis sp. TaxID=1908224 RepID=UPI002ABB3983|nr:prolyl oligopeptidase family serine peptidase [Sphingopyxis sp.]MDZ3832347.1 alpha/beta fold hydrolase [Sphingopyxis sp.]
MKARAWRLPGLLAGLLLCGSLSAQQGPATTAETGTSAPPGTETDIRIEQGVRLENIPMEAEAEGRKLGAHLPTANNYRFVDYAPDGRYMYFARRGDIYRYASATRGAEPYEDRAWSLSGAQLVRACDKEAFLTRRDNNGDEYHDIHLTVRGTPDRLALTSGKARRIALKAADDRRRIAYAASPEGSGIWQVVVHDLCGDTSGRVLATFDDSLLVQDWSPDGSKLVVSLQGDDHHRLLLIDPVTGEEQLLLTSSSPIGNARFSADGRKLFLVANGMSDYRALFQLDLDSGQLADISSALKRDVDFAILSPDRSLLALFVNWEGLSRVMLLDAVNLRKLDSAPDRSPGVVTDAAFSPDNRELVMTLTQPVSPSRTVTFDLQSGKVRALTGGLSDGGGVDLVPQIVRYPTFDEDEGKRREIPALLYLPPKRRDGARLPVVINAHGGPASQHRPEFSRTMHYYVTELGVAVVEPNIRGSTGYGRAFEALDNGMKREDSIRDIGALLDWIRTRPDLDPDRVMIVGGSYGGYVSLAALTHYSDRLRGGIARVGISDFKTFLEETERNRVNNRRREYGDERDPAMAAFFARISPLANAAKIKAPLLIIQGANDPRVPARQAEMIRDAVRANGTPVWFLLSEKDGHSVNSDEAGDWSSGAQIMFIKKHLLGE